MVKPRFDIETFDLDKLRDFVAKVASLKNNHPDVLVAAKQASEGKGRAIFCKEAWDLLEKMAWLSKGVGTMNGSRLKDEVISLLKVFVEVDKEGNATLMCPVIDDPERFSDIFETLEQFGAPVTLIGASS